MDNILRNERKKMKFTQKELAEKIGISTIYVRKIESGYIPRPDIMVKYQEVFNKSVKELFPDYFSAFNDKKFII
ncbi:TPA: helix-turn-helix transcriptional regulator [Bacillus thuringiensis]|uniref:Transcriptional regulator n=1 Tax=Bacillus thuringiensis serovar iberica TaxID=180866 RepID=A0A9X6LGC1_BACTU|nr:helix-turn-helix transcriptional regulator [Bacillus thuringiensis]MEB9625481.1 helix-turn-helix transcriptional regulator [Bacillus cereus]OUB40004.1 transcriptional regulator [Bacillus thuringiensis serovar iberica]HDR5353812.1 helix-turn-helix transcriptional regulator [Bacillus thuringiensis]